MIAVHAKKPLTDTQKSQIHSPSCCWQLIFEKSFFFKPKYVSLLFFLLVWQEIVTSKYVFYGLALGAFSYFSNFVSFKIIA